MRARSLLPLYGGRLNISLVIIEGVTKRYGDLVAVDDLYLSVAAGEIYALLGANGAGKSSLIRVILGIAAADSGRVTVCGQDLAKNARAAKKHIGYLPEELFLYERLTGREYLHLVAGLKEADASTVAAEIEFFELQEAQGKWVGGYSLGMRKKLGLAAAMIGAPDVLVLDEPLNGLDVEMMRKLRARLGAERSAGRAILISSHVMSFVERTCDRIGVMRSGRLIAEGSMEQLRAMTKLSDAPLEDLFFHLVG